MKIIHHRTCVFSIGYHLVFCTKYRRKVLTTKVDAALKQVIAETGIEKGFEVSTIETGLDHVHRGEAGGGMGGGAHRPAAIHGRAAGEVEIAHLNSLLGA